MKRHIILVKAFTKNPKQGNPTGVVLDAAGLTDEQMLRISAELNYSESVFVFPSQVADYKLRYFSPNHEVDLCGHATIATFHVLFSSSPWGEGRVRGLLQPITKSIETNSGILPITLYQDGLIVMQQKKPAFLDMFIDKTEIANLLGISANNIRLDMPMQVVSTGTPKLLIPITSKEVLFAIKPNLSGIMEFCRRTSAKGFYPFVFLPKDFEADIEARQFNPLSDINEDPVTGVAAGALGAYFKHHALFPKKQFVVRQGYNLNKGGKMYVDVRDWVKVGGYAVILGKRMYNK